MGWGTFIAGRLLRTPKKVESNSDEFIHAYSYLAEKFINSYKNRVVPKTVLSHPNVISKIDDLEWEIDLRKRAFRNWVVLQVIVIAYFVFCCFVDPSFISIIFCPLVWYYIKNRLVKKTADDINHDFQAQGYDLQKLLEEIKLIQSEESVKEAENIEQVQKELRKNQEEAHKRKFGID